MFIHWDYLLFHFVNYYHLRIKQCLLTQMLKLKLFIIIEKKLNNNIKQFKA